MLHIRSLRWDDWNIAHVARYQVTPTGSGGDLSTVNFPFFRARNEGSYCSAPTADERMLALVLEHEGDGNYYPITARPASRKERSWYRETLDKE